MSGWHAAGVLFLAVIAGLAVWRWRRVDLDGHIDAALRLANGEGCQCGGSLRDASGVVHRAAPRFCHPTRETITGGVS